MHSPPERHVSLHQLKAALNDAVRLRRVPLRGLMEGDLHLTMCISRES